MMLKDEDRLESENNIVEELDIAEDTTTDTEVLEESDEIMGSNIEQEECEEIMSSSIEQEESEEIINFNLEEEEEDKKVEVRKSGFMSKLGANLIDQGINLAISFVLLHLFNIILLAFGYQVSDKAQVFLIIYAILNVLFTIILESTKLKKSIGKAILKL